MTVSSANWSQERDNKFAFGPHIYPRIFSFDWIMACINGLKQMLNNNNNNNNNNNKQRCWDQASVDHGLKVLESHHLDPYHKARLLTSRNPDGGHWLHAWPISECGLRLDDEAVRVAIGLRLGIALCEEHDCPCGLKVDRRGSHGLSCRRGPGRIPRHDAINDIVYCTLLKVQIPSREEPRGLTRHGSDKRVDGCTLIPWQRERSITWDVTIPDTLANSHLPRTSAVSGAAA